MRRGCCLAWSRFPVAPGVLLAGEPLFFGCLRMRGTDHGLHALQQGFGQYRPFCLTRSGPGRPRNASRQRSTVLIVSHAA